MLARINATPLEAGWVPGAKAGYQLFSSWFVLGELLRRFTGQSFNRLARERIFTPLGIEEAWIGMTPDELDAHRPQLAFLWNTFHREPRPFENSDADVLACRPGSGGRGPANALARLYAALLAMLDEGEPQQTALVKGATLRAFVARQRIGTFDHTFRHVMDWGFGFIPNPRADDGKSMPYGYGPHASVEGFGHGGAQSSCAFADPAHELAVAWICNGRPGEPRHQRRAWSINAAIYEDLGLAAGRSEIPG
jgi:CubicO group peptidase (beta-lactamase class C family)